MGEFLKRGFTAVIFVIVLIAGINIHPIGFFITFLGIALLANYEFYGLVKKAKAAPQVATGLIAVVLLFTACISHIYYGSTLLFLFLLLLVFLSFIIELYRKKENPFANIAYTLLGLMYTALPFALLLYLVFQNGPEKYRSDIVMRIFIMITSFIIRHNYFINVFDLFNLVHMIIRWRANIGPCLYIFVNFSMIHRTGSSL